MIEAGIVPEAELETYGFDESRLPMSGMASYTPGMEMSGGSLGLGVVVEAEHHAPRQLRPTGLEMIACRGRRRQHMHDRNAVDQREDAAVAAEDAVLDVAVGAAVEQRIDEG